MMVAETTGAAGPGRGGRMSRQRKRNAVLRLLRGEDLEMVSRSLGVTAATLSGWRDAFLAAGEASLSSGNCSKPKSPCWRRVPALWPDGRASDEPDGLAQQRQAVWHGSGLPHLVPLPRHPVSAPAPAPVGATTASRADRADGGHRIGRGDPRRAGGQPLLW